MSNRRRVDVAMDRPIIDREFESFLSSMTHAGKIKLGKQQRNEMECAFFTAAGCMVGLFEGLLHSIGGDEKMTDEEEMQRLADVFNRLKEDLVAFSARQRVLAAQLGLKTAKVIAGEGLEDIVARNRRPL